MKNIFLVLILFFINSCATPNISEIQENCYSYKQFEKFHRCAEKLTKDSYQYKFSFVKTLLMLILLRSFGHRC